MIRRSILYWHKAHLLVETCCFYLLLLHHKVQSTDSLDTNKAISLIWVAFADAYPTLKNEGQQSVKRRSADKLLEAEPIRNVSFVPLDAWKNIKKTNDDVSETEDPFKPVVSESGDTKRTVSESDDSEYYDDDSGYDDDSESEVSERDDDSKRDSTKADEAETDNSESGHSVSDDTDLEDTEPDDSEKYKYIDFERSQFAPGEMGTGVTVKSNLPPEVREMVKKGWKLYCFNVFVSDHISVQRSLPDVRDDLCKVPGRHLPIEQLPVTSVVICFRNEAMSVLLRTVHSVVDHSPPPLIKEIILVDDFSEFPYLKTSLEQYLATFEKVRIVRAPKRLGLIRARLVGADLATAPVLTFLDSHSECTTGWLEPLLDRVARNPRTVACPLIDAIDDDTFELDASDFNFSMGGFDWNLDYEWFEIPEREHKRRNTTVDPLWSPTMAGGYFSINKAFFEYLGTYDPELLFWGSENLELSFKTWMCGGTLETLPCSRVGHIFRKCSPHSWESVENVVTRNKVRLAKVWLDEYANYYYERMGNHLPDPGDVSNRKELRRRLGCKSFKWYIDNIYPELFDPKSALATGEIRNPRKYMCLDSKAAADGSVGAKRCHDHGGNQYWTWTRTGEIQQNRKCLHFNENVVDLVSCENSSRTQFWKYVEKHRLILHASKLCLQISDKWEHLEMAICDTENERQIWAIGHRNTSSDPG